MAYKVINAVSSKNIPKWGNTKKYIALHYLGVVGQNHELSSDGCGAHYYIYWDGTIYKRCDHNAIVWAVGTAGYYTQKHAEARNANTISIEMCCKCDGNSASAEDKKWYFTKETQEAAVWLVKKLMKELGIPAENVLRHYDIVNKTCPAPYVHNNKYKTSWTWEEFKAKISDADSTKLGFQASDLQGLTEAERIAKIAPLYQECMAKTGLLASVGIAQFCLESGYGSTDLAVFANNLHGMKANLSGNTWPGSAWDGSSAYCKKTAEQDQNGNEYYVNADFRKYSKCEDSIADRAAYFTNAMNGQALRYPGLVGERDYKKAIQIIKDGGYATDVNYVAKLINLVERWSLYQYDEGIKMPELSTGEILPETGQKWIRVGTAWKNRKCIGQIGAFLDLENAKKWADKYSTEENQTYIAFDENGLTLYTALYKEEVRYIVQLGSYEMEVNAKRMYKKAVGAGFDAIIKYVGNQYKVQCGAFEKKNNAETLKKKLESAGFSVIIRTEKEVELSEHIVLQQCKKFQKRLEEDLVQGIRWEYHNPSKYLKERWQQALDCKKYACNCALLARWALKEAGLIPQNTGIFYGKKGGSISWGSGTKAAVQKTCNLISIQNKTVKQLIAEGRLQAGDIVTYVDLQHTNIYAGSGKWYDAGHAYCSESGEGAKYNSWYGAGMYDSQKVGWIIRKKIKETAAGALPLLYHNPVSTYYIAPNGVI